MLALVSSDPVLLGARVPRERRFLRFGDGRGEGKAFHAWTREIRRAIWQFGFLIDYTDAEFIHYREHARRGRYVKGPHRWRYVEPRVGFVRRASVAGAALLLRKINLFGRLIRRACDSARASPVEGASLGTHGVACGGMDVAHLLSLHYVAPEGAAGRWNQSPRSRWSRPCVCQYEGCR